MWTITLIINVYSETNSINRTFVKTEIFKANQANTVADGALALSIPNVLTLYDKPIRVLGQ